MVQTTLSSRLDRPVDETFDHALGPADAQITLVEYGSYACPSCRAANEAISDVRDQFGNRLRYVFRHRPIPGSDIARRAAELVERAGDPERFWDAYIKLMARSERLTEDDLLAVAADLNLTQEDPAEAEKATRLAQVRVDADVTSAYASGVAITPTFFINGRRYQGPWDQHSLSDAMLGTLGHRVHSAMLEFVRWGPSAGVLLLLATILALLNRAHIYRLSPYMLLGIVLWACIHAGGVHATLAGVILALFIPTRPPPNLRALVAQANTIIAAEATHVGEVLRHGPSLPALHALDGIHDRLESPAARLLRHAGARSSYLVLPLFAFANAGVVVAADVIHGHQQLMLAIILGLVVGKPLGMVSASALAVWSGIAVKPDAYSWGHLSGAGALAGIGFTMSLFVAGQAFPSEADFAAAKIAVFSASILSAVIGVLLLWRAGRASTERQPTR